MLNIKQALVRFAFNNFWPRSFLNYVKGHLKNEFGDEAEAITRQMLARARKARLEYQRLATDKMTDSFVSTCATIAGCYEVLLGKMDSKEEVIEFLRHSFKHTAQAQSKLYFRMLMLGPDKLTAISGFFREGMPLYGKSFEYEYIEDANFFGCHIKKCFFHDFFTAYGEPQLTTVLCHWDENWLNEIDSEVDGVEFFRPTTLGYGGEECIFDFKRTSAIGKFEE